MVLQRKALWEGVSCVCSPSTAQRWGAGGTAIGSGPFNKLRLMMVSNAQDVGEEGKKPNLVLL